MKNILDSYLSVSFPKSGPLFESHGHSDAVISASDRIRDSIVSICMNEKSRRSHMHHLSGMNETPVMVNSGERGTWQLKILGTCDDFFALATVNVLMDAPYTYVKANESTHFEGNELCIELDVWICNISRAAEVLNVMIGHELAFLYFMYRKAVSTGTYKIEPWKKDFDVEGDMEVRISEKLPDVARYISLFSAISPSGTLRLQGMVSMEITNALRHSEVPEIIDGKWASDVISGTAAVRTLSELDSIASDMEEIYDAIPRGLLLMMFRRMFPKKKVGNYDAMVRHIRGRLAYVRHKVLQTAIGMFASPSVSGND